MVDNTKYVEAKSFASFWNANINLHLENSSKSETTSSPILKSKKILPTTENQISRNAIGDLVIKTEAPAFTNFSKRDMYEYEETPIYDKWYVSYSKSPSYYHREYSPLKSKSSSRNSKSSRNKTPSKVGSSFDRHSSKKRPNRKVSRHGDPCYDSSSSDTNRKKRRHVYYDSYSSDAYTKREHSYHDCYSSNSYTKRLDEYNSPPSDAHSRGRRDKHDCPPSHAHYRRRRHAHYDSSPSDSYSKRPRYSYDSSSTDTHTRKWRHAHHDSNYPIYSQKRRKRRHETCSENSSHEYCKSSHSSKSRKRRKRKHRSTEKSSKVHIKKRIDHNRIRNVCANAYNGHTSKSDNYLEDISTFQKLKNGSDIGDANTRLHSLKEKIEIKTERKLVGKNDFMSSEIAPDYNSPHEFLENVAITPKKHCNDSWESYRNPSPEIYICNSSDEINSRIATVPYSKSEHLDDLVIKDLFSSMQNNTSNIKLEETIPLFIGGIKQEDETTIVKKGKDILNKEDLSPDKMNTIQNTKVKLEKVSPIHMGNFMQEFKMPQKISPNINIKQEDLFPEMEQDCQPPSISSENAYIKQEDLFPELNLICKNINSIPMKVKKEDIC